ncbi:MAG: LysM peptidoglycan-binding domain-containing protein [Haloarculaceae archaeon]
MKRHASRSERGTQPTTRRSEAHREADRSNSQTGSDPVASLHRTAGNQAVGTTVQRQQSGDESDELSADISDDAAVYAVTRALRNRGFTPAPGLTLEDYLETDVTQATRGETVTGTREVYVRVGPDGNLLPSQEWLEQEQEAGRVEEGTLQGATRLLNFELFQYPDGQHDVAMKLMRVESAVIKNQRMGEGGAMNTGLTEAIDNAWDKFEVEFGQPTDGRVPDDAGGQSDGSQTDIDVPSRGVDLPTSTQVFDESGSVFEAGLSSLGMGLQHSANGGTYEVEEGDTLWDIAKREYGDGEKWGVIFEANRKTEQNPDGIEDPDLIHPGQELVLPPQRKADQFDRAEYDAPESYGIGEGKF